MWVRQRPYQHRINHAEDGGASTDADGEREQGDGGEARGFAEHAEGYAKIQHS